MALRPLLLGLQCPLNKCLATRSFQIRTMRFSQLTKAWRSRSQSNSQTGSWGYVGVVAVLASTTGLSLNWYQKRKEGGTVLFLPTLRAADKDGEDIGRKVSLRERRYKDFASVVYHREPYMTPRDFLESVTKDTPRCEHFIVACL